MDGRGVRFICSVETQALECPVRYVVLLRETVTVRYRYNLSFAGGSGDLSKERSSDQGVNVSKRR